MVSPFDHVGKCVPGRFSRALITSRPPGVPSVCEGSRRSSSWWRTTLRRPAVPGSARSGRCRRARRLRSTRASRHSLGRRLVRRTSPRRDCCRGLFSHLKATESGLPTISPSRREAVRTGGFDHMNRGATTAVRSEGAPMCVDRDGARVSASTSAPARGRRVIARDVVTIVEPSSRRTRRVRITLRAPSQRGVRRVALVTATTSRGVMRTDTAMVTRPLR